MQVDWKTLDLSQPKRELPPPLHKQAGGRFWICVDGGVHGKRIVPAWWTGGRFLDWNNDRITHFAMYCAPDGPGSSDGEG